MTTQIMTFPKIPKTKLFLVGGCVRDTIMGHAPKDRDFVAVTEMSFQELVSAVNSIGRVFQESEQHLTLRCLIDREPVDIALPRTESGTTDNRHPEIVLRASTLEADAARRDLTINAMFMGENGEILDFFGGQDDIKEGIIRSVGNPEERFTEDALRILRAIRFAGRFNFSIDFYTRLAMIRKADLLFNISADRIREEINKALLANPKHALSHILDMDIFDVLVAKKINFQVTSKEMK